jgi:hypothetical protein
METRRPVSNSSPSICPPEGCAFCRGGPSVVDPDSDSKLPDTPIPGPAQDNEESVISNNQNINSANSVPPLRDLLHSEHVIAKSGTLFASVSQLSLAAHVKQQQQQQQSMTSAGKQSQRKSQKEILEEASDTVQSLPGKRAISHYQLTHVLPQQRMALFDVRTETGRKHQLRVQFAGL